MRRVVGLILFVLVSVGISAQVDFLILGRVTDKSNEQPISHANVWIKGTNVGTESNDEGYFLIRTENIEKFTLAVSALGYKRREVRLSNVQDQWVNVEMVEDALLLDEVVVLPSANPATDLIKRMRERREENNPDILTDVCNSALESSDLYMLNVRRKWLQKKLLRDMLSGTVVQEDSSLLVPLYHLDEEKRQHKSSKGDATEEIATRNENALEVVGKESLGTLLADYGTEVNFYKNNVTLFDRDFVSPLAKFGNSYYQYHLMDSSVVDGRKRYVVRFIPKNLKDLVFRGEMEVDSLTAALVKINAQMPASTNINYVSDIVIGQEFKLYEEKWVYANKSVAATLKLQFNKEDNSRRGMMVILNKKGIYANYANASDRAETENFEFPDSTKNSIQNYNKEIDSLNNTKIVRFANGLVDLILHGYVHAWKFDIGPVVNFYKYNKLEGHRISFGLRTGESMMKHVTIGGWFGYGFGNKEWRYGGEIQAQFGKNNRHKVGVIYSDNVEEYGSQHYMKYLNENHVGDVYNIFSSFKWDPWRKWHFGDGFARRKREEVFYRYEGKDLTATADIKHENIYANAGINFTSGENNYSRMELISATASARISFNQRYIDGFFHRYYLYNNLPVLYIMAEYGHYSLKGKGIKDKTGDYGKIITFMRHDFPLLGGKFKYRIEMGHVIGNTPWTLLDITREGSGLLISDSKFCFLQPMEFISDTYGYVGITYFTKGFLFNWIPYIKKLNLREVVSVHCAMGSVLNKGNEKVLDYPSLSLTDGNLNQMKIPYVEVSVGIANICRLLAIESVWRCTHRDNPNAVKWGVRLRFNVDF